MIEPISSGIMVAIPQLVKSAPSWLPTISDLLVSPARDVFIGKMVEKGVEKSIEGGRKLLHSADKEQKRHMELALKNAAERGLARFQGTDEQKQYSKVLTILSEQNPHSDLLRHEALSLFTLDTPDFTKLNTLYNDAIRTRSQGTASGEVNAAPFLTSFFDALISELYTDPFFRQQISRALQDRATIGMQRSLTEVVASLHQVYSVLEQSYTPEQFEKDIQDYIEHIERTLRFLEPISFIPSEHTQEHKEPELNGVFVPLRIEHLDQRTGEDQKPESIVEVLEQASYLVLLGGPGSGKSTATRHLAWSHAEANQSIPSSLSKVPLLAGKPIPLCIELRRLTETRRQRPDYDFLTYASEILFKREGLNTPPQMFEILLERRLMLILFDGLDEVATIDDRRTLVKEIERFAQHYPGNRFLVTSRSVGYERAPLSKQTFAQARVLPFDNQQIHEFLENWYTHLYRLSQADQKELEDLYSALKDKPHLHDLAEIPLLLTVIIFLHRYKTLPEKRVLLYDDCADLLLKRWLERRNTNVRWQDIKLGKGDQYTCIAHLGFVLHKRAQATNTSSAAIDVPTRFIQREIKEFLQSQHLFDSKAEQNFQAERFLELVQEEAGLIVDRGTDENNERLYGFVHRTFQEYFAAADVYERFKQEDDPTLISEFLREYLHDPHWQEVILLLFGKLGTGPTTKQLEQILKGEIKNRRNQYAEILRQDLFFASTCLAEKVEIDKELAGLVISELGNLVKCSPFPPQPSQALSALGRSTQAQPYAILGQNELRALVARQDTRLSSKLQAAETMYKSCLPNSEGRQYVIQEFLSLIQQSHLPIVQRVLVAHTLYSMSPLQSKEEQQFAKILFNLAQKPEFPIDEAIKEAQRLHVLITDYDDYVEEWQQSTPILLGLLQRAGLSIQQAIDAAQTVHLYYGYRTQAGKQANQLLLRLSHDSDIPFRKMLLIALIVHKHSHSDSDERHEALQIFSKLLNWPKLSTKQILQLIDRLLENRINELRDQVIRILTDLSKQPGLSFEHAIKIAETLHSYNDPEAREQAIQLLIDLAQRSSLFLEEQVSIAKALCKYESQPNEIAMQMLFSRSKQPNLTVEQIVLISKTLCECNRFEKVTQNGKIADAEELTLDFLFDPEIKEFEPAIQLLLNLAERPDLSLEQAITVADTLYRYGSSTTQQHADRLLLGLAERDQLSNDKNALILIYETLYQYGSIQAQQFAIQQLINFMEQSELSIEVIIFLVKNDLEPDDYSISDSRQQTARTLLLDLAQRPTILPDQILQLASVLYSTSRDESVVQKQIVQIISHLLSRTNLHPEQQIAATHALYEYSLINSDEERQAIEILWQLLQNGQLLDTQRLQVAAIPLSTWKAHYPLRVKAVREVLNVSPPGLAKQYFQEHWRSAYDDTEMSDEVEVIENYYYDNRAGASDIPYIAELAKQGLLPTYVRSQMYWKLSNMLTNLGT